MTFCTLLVTVKLYTFSFIRDFIHSGMEAVRVVRKAILAIEMTTCMMFLQIYPDQDEPNPGPAHYLLISGGDGCCTVPHEKPGFQSKCEIWYG